MRGHHTSFRNYVSINKFQESSKKVMELIKVKIITFKEKALI